MNKSPTGQDLSGPGVVDHRSPQPCEPSNPPRGQVRTLVLFLTVLSLAATAFESGPLQSIAGQLRLPLAILLLLSTLQAHAGTGGTLKGAPRTARSLILLAWLFTAASLALVPYSLEPSLAISQLSAWTLLVATMQVHVTKRWQHHSALTSDIRTIFWALVATVAPSPIIDNPRSVRFSGLFDNPNTLALTALLTACLGVGIVAERKNVLLTLVAIFACMGSVLIAETRTAIVALVAAGLVLALRRINRRSRIPLSLLVSAWGAVTIACGFLLTRGRLPLPAVSDRFFAEDLNSFNTRDLAWQYALDLWSLRPMTGYGFRTGELAFQQNRNLTAFARDSAHNSYLQTLMEVGILGFIPFAMMLAVLVVAVLRSPARGIGLGLVATLTAGLIAAATESFMLGVGQAACWVFWLVAAAAGSLTDSQGKATTEQKGY